jgi:hypothetical protein
MNDEKHAILKYCIQIIIDQLGEAAINALLLQIAKIIKKAVDQTDNKFDDAMAKPIITLLETISKPPTKVTTNETTTQAKPKQDTKSVLANSKQNT